MSVDDAEVAAAYERAAMAYDVARSEVFSRYPDGVPPQERLSQRERDVLQDHEREQLALKELRQARASRSPLAEVELVYGDDGEPRRMRCTTCGEQTPFDERLPYVNQSASFSTGHDCVVVLPE